MKRNLVAPLLFVPALLAMESRGDSPAFAPQEGTVLKKVIENQTDITLDDMEMSVNGQDMSEMLGDMELSTSTVLVTKVTDTYGGSSDGRPTKVTRTYEELNSTQNATMTGGMMGGDGDGMEMLGSSELEGTTVLFTWDGDADAYDIAFDEDSDADDELLEGLEEDMDLREFLPDGEVGEGDAWDVDPSALRSVLSPGGDLKVSLEDTGMGMGMGSSTPPNFGTYLQDFDGEITAKFEATEDGIAVISLALDVSSSSDLTEFMEEMLAEQEMPEGMEIDISIDAMDMEYTFEGEGELRWNLAGGTFESLKIEGEIEQISDSAMAMSMGGQEQAMEQSMSFSGTQTIEFSVDG